MRQVGENSGVSPKVKRGLNLCYRYFARLTNLLERLMHHAALVTLADLSLSKSGLCTCGDETRSAQGPPPLIDAPPTRVIRSRKIGLSLSYPAPQGMELESSGRGSSKAVTYDVFTTLLTGSIVYKLPCVPQVTESWTNSSQ